MTPLIPQLQALRFVAAAMVLLSHLQHEVPSVRGLDVAGYAPWQPVFFAGGVDIFFVISGFIMHTIAAPHFGQPGAARSFFLRRLLRVVPPYWFFTTAMLLAALLFSGQVAHSQLSLPHVLASYLFLPFENPYGKIYPLLILGWTLNFEMMFYAVFALGLMFPRRWGLAFIGAVIGGLGLVGLVFEPARAPLAFWCNPIVFEFLMGIALAWCLQRGVRWSPAAGAVSIAAGVAAMVWAVQAGIAGHHWAARALWMGLPACLVCAGVVWVRPQGKPGPLMRALMVGGDASFTLYLSHPFTLTVVAALWPRTGLAWPTAYVVAGAVASIAVSVGIHRWIEQPGLRRLNVWLHAGTDRPHRVTPLRALKEPHAH